MMEMATAIRELKRGLPAGEPIAGACSLDVSGGELGISASGSKEKRKPEIGLPWNVAI